LDDASLQSGQVLQLTRRLLGGLYVDACHLGVRVCFELLRQLLRGFDRAPSWPVIGKACACRVLRVCVVHRMVLCVWFFGPFFNKLDHVSLINLIQWRGALVLVLEKKNL
jgi:hypothetical protein